MKVKYLFVYFIILLSVSGCSAEYNLDVDTELNFNESITIYSSTGNEYDQVNNYNTFLPINYDADEPKVFEQKVDGVDYYNINKDSDGSFIKFDYKHSLKSIINDRFSLSCYKYVNIMNIYNEDHKRNELVISTSDKFLCFDYYENLDDVTVKIHTKRDVYSNNADVVDKDTYIWNINKTNKNDKSIIMNISSEAVDKKMSFFERNLFFIIVILLVVLGICLYFYFKKKSDRIDSI